MIHHQEYLIIDTTRFIMESYFQMKNDRNIKFKVFN